MRKALRLTVVLVLVVASAQAQITKGSVLLGTDLAFFAQKNTDTINRYKQSNFSFSPSVGIAIKQNMILGLQVITGFQANKPTGYPANTVATCGGGLFMRRYWQLGKAVYLFGQADAYGTNAGTKQHDGGYTYITKDTRFGLSVYPGAMYAVTRHFQLEAALGDLIDVQYRTYSYKYKYNNSTVNLAKQTTFVASSTLNGYTAFTLGFRFLL